MPIHYLETGSVDPCTNLAVEQVVLENRREGDWLLLWQNANTVVIGLNQNTAEEVDPAFVEAAMALAKPGDHSGKVKSTIGNGYHIIRYESDEAEGPTALDAVKETISSSLLDTKKTEAYNAAKKQWVEEAGIKVDLNALK